MNLLIRQIPFKSAAGFSLVELMIVIGILGILSVISIPALINPEHKARKAARELVGDMQQTRMAAIKNNQNWVIVFDTASNLYVICSDPGPDDDWATIADNTVKKTVRFTDYAAGVKYGNGAATKKATIAGDAFGGSGDFVSYPSKKLYFYPSGNCNSGYVYLTYGGSSYAVGTLLTGLIRVKRWTGIDWK